MCSRETIVQCLALLQGTFPQIAATEMALKAWEMGLGRFTDRQVMLGTEMVVRYHTYGMPAPAHIAEMIQGKPKRVLNDSVYAATYKTVRAYEWEERQDIPPGGLTPEEARAALTEGMDAPVAPALAEEDTAALTEGLANHMDPRQGD